MKRSTALRAAALALASSLAIAGIGAYIASSGSSGGSARRALHNSGGVSAAGLVPGKGTADGGTTGGPASIGSHGTALGDLVLGSSKIRIAQLEVVVKHGESVAAKANAANAIALAAGGEVDADERTSGKFASATLVLGIPPDHLTQVLDELSKLGVEHSRQLSTEDVTSKVADVASRVNSARDAIARLRALYQHATKVGDVITIESELSGRESDLESLQAQQRSLAAQTATATVTLSLTQKVTTVAKRTTKHDRSGFLGGLQSGWDAFSRGAYALSTAVGAFLPFAVLLIVLALAGRLLWPRLRPARRPVPAGPPAE